MVIKSNVNEPLAIYNTNGVTLNTNLLASTHNNATTNLNYYIDEELQQSSIDFTIKDASEKYSMGLSDFSATSTAIQFGFFVNSKTVKFYVNGTLESTKYSVKNNNILTLEKNGSTLYYKINNVVFRQVTLTGPYLLTTQIEIAKGSTTFGVTTKGPSKKTATVSANVKHATCDDPDRAASFVITLGNLTGLAYTYTVKNVITGDDVTSNTTGTPALGSTINLGNLPFGVYVIRGHITASPAIGVQFLKVISIGIESQFQPKVNYTLTPNTYSLKKETAFGLTASALTLNIIRASETQGWVSLIPYAQNVSPTGNYISFNSDYSMMTPNVNTGTFVLITRNQNTSQGPGFDQGGYYYKFYSNGAFVERYYAVKKRVTAFIDGSVIRFYVDNLLSDVTLPRPPGDLHIKFVSKQLNESFSDVASTFRCIEQGLNMIGYRKVTRELDKSFSYAIQGQLKFILDEEYDIESNKFIPMKLYTDKNILLGSVSFDGIGNLPALEYNFEDNRYILDLSGLSLSYDSYYYLEFTGPKNQKRYFKFYNKH